ncbi:hypothetical protein BH09BAC5_BH09BAC5_09910 [soil metagenome]
MKKHIILGLIAVMAVAFTFSSCGKYEDGPSFSLLTKKMRITGDWKLTNYTSNGTDVTSVIVAFWGSSYELQIEKDNSYKMTGNVNESGIWSLGADKDDITFTPSSGTPSTYRILRLKNTELWLRYTNSNGTYDVIKFNQ